MSKECEEEKLFDEIKTIVTRKTDGITTVELSNGLKYCDKAKKCISNDTIFFHKFKKNFWIKKCEKIQKFNFGWWNKKCEKIV